MDTYKRLIIISIYLFFSIYLCPAFTLTGIIEDSDNPDITVKNTVIVVKKLNKIVYPDKNSKFSIKNLPKGTYSIDVTAPGYNKKRIIVIIDKTDISLKIRLTPETIVMNPIIVSAEKTKRQSPDSTVFTSDEIRTAPTAGNPFNIVPLLEGALTLNTIENTGDVIPWDMPGGYLLGEQGYTNKLLWDERDDETGKLSLSKDYNYSSYEINIGDEFAYYLLSSMTLNMGSKINLLNLNGDLKTFRIRKMYYDSSGLNDQFKDQGKDFEYNREIKGISPYIYANLDFRNDFLSWVLGLGYKWYDIEKIGGFTTLNMNDSLQQS